MRRSEKPKPSTPVPEFIPPMRATLVQELPDDDEWLYDVKWDGYRALAIKHGKNVRLLSLKDKSLASAFPGVVDAVRTIGANTALLDGEVVAVNARGQPSFQALQNRASLKADWRIVYYAFDLLSLEGEDLRGRPLHERKAKLEGVLHGSEVRYSAPLLGSLEEIVDAVRAAGLEGVIAKRRDASYEAGKRSTAWRKLKLSLSQEFLIGGYNPERTSFSSVLVGYYEESKLLFAGKVRQGFSPGTRASLMRKLRTFETQRCPFANLPSSKTGHFGEGITAEDMDKLQWIEPKLVAQVSFTEWTDYGVLRHATFLGLREDKDPSEVVKETGSQLTGGGAG